ncbi:MAG: amino acid permease [Anaerolineae bacterium]|nr:amino acid permease [Anaerolineae bacterium]
MGPGNWLGLTFATGFYLLGFAEYVAYFLPIPSQVTVILAGALFIWLNYRGAKLSGSVQNFIVIILVLILGLFVIRGLFSIDPELHKPFLPHGWSAVVECVGLIIVSFTGFEKVSTIAEEIKQPGRNLPLAIIGAVCIATLLYSFVLYVSTGIVAYAEQVTYQAPLVEAANRFMSTAGIIGMSIAALLATASSANAAILASSRINYAMGRDCIMPDWFNAIHPKFLTPYRSVVVTGIGAVLLALSGQAEVLTEVSSALFMVSYALLAISVLVMRQSHPTWYKPSFRVPLYPIVPVLGGVLAIAVIFTMKPMSQLAGAGLVVVSLMWYAVWVRHKAKVAGTLRPWLAQERPLEPVIARAARGRAAAEHEILVAISNPKTVDMLMKLAIRLAKSDANGAILALNVIQVPHSISLEAAEYYIHTAELPNKETVERALVYAEECPLLLRVRQQPAYGIASGLVAVAANRPETRLILLGWHGDFVRSRIEGHVIEEVIRLSPDDVAVFLDRGLNGLKRILVPAGGGPHARLGVRIACNLLPSDAGEITIMRVASSEEEEEVQAEALKHLVENEQGQQLAKVVTKVVRAGSIVEGVITEARQGYDLVIIGASEQWALRNWLFGSIPDSVAEAVPCSVLMVRKREPEPLSRVRRIVKGVRE